MLKLIYRLVALLMLHEANGVSFNFTYAPSLTLLSSTSKLETNISNSYTRSSGPQNASAGISHLAYKESWACSTDWLNSMAIHGSIWTTTQTVTVQEITRTFTDINTRGPFDTCCGYCALLFPIVQVFFWPSINRTCNSNVSVDFNNVSNLPAIILPPSGTDLANVPTSILFDTAPPPQPPVSRGLNRRDHSLFNETGSIAVNTDGFTFTSPSVYVILSTIRATDQCRQLGSVHTSLTFSFAPGEISTVAWLPYDPYTWGQRYSTGAFDFATLPCAPASTTFADYMRGFPWAPFIAPPKGLNKLDLLWENCTADVFQGWDPPMALTPVAALMPDPTTTPPKGDPQTAAPASTPVKPITLGPTSTTLVQPSIPTDPPSPNPPASKPPGYSAPAGGDPPLGSSVDPVQPASRSSSIGVISHQPQNSPAQPPSVPSPNPGAGDPSPKSPAQPVGISAPNNVGVGIPPQSIANQPVNVPGATNNAPMQPQNPSSSSGSGSAGIDSAQPVNVPSQNSGKTSPGNPPSQASGNPSNPGNNDPGSNPAVVVQGHTIAQDAPSTTINGNIVAYSAGTIHVGSFAAPVQQAQPSQQYPSTPVAIAGYTFVPVQGNSPGASKPAAVIVQGQTISEGSPPVTIGGSAIAYSGGSVYVGKNGAPGPSAVIQPQQPPSLTVVGGLTFSPLTAPGAPSVTPVVIAGQTASVNPNGAVMINGQTIAPNASPANVNGVPVSLGSAGLVVGTSTISLAPHRGALATVGTQIITSAGSSGAVGIGGTTLTPGGSAITKDGTVISLAPSGILVIGSSNIQVPPAPTLPAFRLGSQIVTANAASQYIIDGQTLIPGSPGITAEGTYVSIPAGASNVVIGTNTYSLGPKSTLPALTFGSQVITANAASVYIVDGQTLIPGGPGITAEGTYLSVPTGATNVVVGKSTYPLGSKATLPAFTFGSRIVTANAASQYVIDGQTAVPGGPGITAEGTYLSIPSGASSIVIGTRTYTLNANPTLPPFTFGSQTITANSASQYIINGQTFIPGGPAITVDGTYISLPATPSNVVIGSSTEVLAPTQDIGPAILSGFGAPATASTPAAYTGAGVRHFCSLSITLLCAMTVGIILL